MNSYGNGRCALAPKFHERRVRQRSAALFTERNVISSEAQTPRHTAYLLPFSGRASAGARIAACGVLRNAEEENLRFHVAA